MINKYKKFIFVIVLILFFSIFLAVNFSLAAGLIKDDATKKIKEQTNTTAEAGGEGYDIAGVDALGVVQIAINIFLSVIGVLLLTYMLYAGYNWMTAQGDEEKVTKAKDTIKRAIVGAIIIVGAYAISVFVISRIEAGTLKPVSYQKSFSHNLASR